MITIVLGLLVLGALVVFHEYGHFVVARALGVRVERFSVGFGPVVLSRVHRGVEYAISAIPMGGYVKMGGDDPRDRESLQPGDLFYASWWRRVLIALAGPGANFLLAIVLSISLLWIGFRAPDMPTRIGTVEAGSLADSLGFRAGDTIDAVAGSPVGSLSAFLIALDDQPRDAQVAVTVSGEPGSRDLTVPTARAGALLEGLDFPIPAEIGEVVIGTPAYTSGLKAGDRILKIDDTPIKTWRDMQGIVRGAPGREIALTVLRDEREVSLSLTPAPDKMGDETIGRIGISPASGSTILVRRGFVDGIVEGTQSTVMMVGFMFKGIGSLFTSVSNLKQVAGPVAIIQSSGDAAQGGIDKLLDRAILFSIALMVFNLLPVPILDGGMVVLSVLEGIRRRPVGSLGLAVYQGIGVAVLGTLLVFVLINDPLRILQRRSALGRLDDIAP